MDTFVKDLVAYASCKQEDFDIRATWRASSPSGGMDEIEDFLGTVRNLRILWVVANDM